VIIFSRTGSATKKKKICQEFFFKKKKGILIKKIDRMRHA
jgi:hypothetical protein